MILHYVAAAQIALMVLFHFVMGGKNNALRYLTKHREDGEDALSSRSHVIIWIGILAFSASSAILLVVPQVPIWAEFGLGGSWLILAVADLALNRGKTSGGYFALSTGTLIVLGNFA